MVYGHKLATGFTLGFQNLNKFLRKYYLPHNYKFESIVPQNRLVYRFTPREHWKLQKDKQNFIKTSILFGLFVVGFGIADFLYSFTHNPKQSYRLYILYPIPTKLIDDILNDQNIRPWIEIGKDFWVKDYIEFRAFWHRVYKQLWEKKQIEKNKIKDEKAQLLKEEIQEANKKFPMPRQEQKQSVF